MIVPFRAARELLTTIPGIQQRNAEIIIAEIGVDMTRFATPAHLASWAGVCPGNNESAGKHRSTHTRHGDPWLQSALVEAAWSAVRTKNCYLAVRFWRIAKRRGQQRALIAIAHTMLIICWHMLSERHRLHEHRRRLPRPQRQPRPTPTPPHQPTRTPRLPASNSPPPPGPQPGSGKLRNTLMEIADDLIGYQRREIVTRQSVEVGFRPI